MKTQAAIFDLEGVLVLTRRYHLKAWNLLCDAHGWNNVVADGGEPETLNRILQENGVTLSEEEREALLAEKRRYFEHSLEAMESDDFYPGAIGFVIELRAHEVLTAIAAATPAARRVIESLDMGELFDAIVVGEELGPDASRVELYRAAVEELGLEPPNATIFSDDNRSLEAARSLGAGAVGVGAPRDLGAAEFVVNNFSDIEFTRFLRTGEVA
jgi:HAD superfamily hydrolase (TIGR01509 family)